MGKAFRSFFLFLILFLAFPNPTHAACTSPTGSAGTMLYNADYHVHQYCNDTNWRAMGATSTSAVFGFLDSETTYAAAAYGVWGDGSYIYVADDTYGIDAFSFSGSTFTYKATNDTNSTSAVGVWGDGSYIYVADGAGGIDAYTFDGASFTYKATNTTNSTNARGVWGDGTYLYVADSTGGIDAYTFNGTSFTYKATNTTNSTNASGVWGDGTYVYVADGAGGIDAYTFNGTAFSYLATNTTNSTQAQKVWGDGTYIYVADWTGGVDAYTFNGTSFTYLATNTANSVTARDVWGDGSYIYVADDTGGVDIYTFNGSSFSYKTTNTSSTINAYGVWGDGTTLYVADGSDGLDAYAPSGSCSLPTAAGGAIRYNPDWRTMQYCNGALWVSMGPKIRTFTPAVTFDGTNDYLTYGTSFGTDSTMATASFWFRRNGGNGSQKILFCVEGGTTDCRFEIDLTTGNQIHVRGSSSGGGGTGTTRVEMTGSTAITNTNWHHVLLSFDSSDTTGCTTSVSTGKCKIYLDGAAETVTVNTTFSNANIDFTRTSYSFGAFTGGTGKFNGDVDDFWLDEGTYLDLSQDGVRAKFIDASGNPVDLGATGTNPTGSQPEVYFSSRGNGLSGWPTNKGSGGGFTLTGALTASTANLPNLSCSHIIPDLISTTTTSLSQPSQISGDGNYIYVGDTYSGVNEGLHAWSFDGQSFTHERLMNSSQTFAVWAGDGYIYQGSAGGYLRAYTFNGTTSTLVGTYSSNVNTPRDIWGGGGYIYVVRAAGLEVYSFDGSSFTLVASDTSHTTSAYGVWWDGTYIYVADTTGGLDAYSFNGSSLTYITSETTNAGNAQTVWGDGTYIYLADSGGGIDVYTFNGTAFTFLATDTTHSTSARSVWGEIKNGTRYIYVADGDYGLDTYTFNGTALDFISSNESGGLHSKKDVWGDGKYVYVTDSLTGYYRSLSAYETTADRCSCSSPTALEGTKLYNSDYNVYQYCNGQNWMRMGQ
jgi:hypothetical protein